VIGVIASVISALILKNYFMLFSVLVFLFSRKNRDLGLIAYFIYSLFVSEHYIGIDIYYYTDLINSLIFAFSLILLLDDVLRREIVFGKLESLSSILMIGSLVVPEMFLAGTFFYFLVKFKPDLLVILSLVSLIAVFVIFKERLDLLGGATNQVMVLASFALFITVLTLIIKRNLKKVNMFTNN